MTSVHLLSGYEAESGAARRGTPGTVLGPMTRNALVILSLASRGRREPHGPRTAASPPRARRPGNHSGLATPPWAGVDLSLVLRFETGLPYSLPLGFLGATRGVRGASASTLTLHPPAECHPPWTSVTWMGSAGHSNPSSSDFLGWGGVLSPRVRVLSLSPH